jgi:guanylate kinase
MSADFYPRVLVVSGPSGVGKSTIIRGAMERIPAIRLSVSCTTRPQRASEEDGRDYFFIARETFEERIAAGDFLEWAQVFDNYYGTGKSTVQELLGKGHHALLDVDTTGALNIKAISSGVVFVFIRPPSLAELETRLRGRGSETEQTLATRLARAESEIALSDRYDHIIVNDDAERAIAELVAIIRREEARPVPFLTDQAAAPEAAPAEQLAEALTGKLAPALRAEMVTLIGDQLKAVLDRDLGSLMLEALQERRKGR